MFEYLASASVTGSGPVTKVLLSLPVPSLPHAVIQDVSSQLAALAALTAICSHLVPAIMDSTLWNRKHK